MRIMNLPNYFLADLPPEAALTPSMIGEACQTLKRNRERYLFPRSTQNLINVLSGLAKCWLEPNYPFRKLALEQGPAATGFSTQTLANGLDAFFKQLTRENFQALLEQDLGSVQRLDEMASAEAEQRSNRAAVGGRLGHRRASNSRPRYRNHFPRSRRVSKYGIHPSLCRARDR